MRTTALAICPPIVILGTVLTKKAARRVHKHDTGPASNGTACKGKTPMHGSPSRRLPILSACCARFSTRFHEFRFALDLRAMPRCTEVQEMPMQ